MLKMIVKKELQNNIFSFRFLVAFVLLIIIVAITVFILTDDYVKKVDEYSKRQSEIDNYMRNYAHFNRVGAVIMPSQPPLPFSCLIRGISPDDENVFGEFNTDPLPVMFPLIDLTFIVTILVSLIALLFSYDSICGEKEEGTLKLILSNKLSRVEVILGKIIGGILTLFIPFLISLAIGLLIINLNRGVSWKEANWGAFGFIFLGAVLYFTFFYCIGIFISSRHHSSSSSIMTSLFVWVLFILIIPNLSPYVASFLYPTPSKIKIEREIRGITDVGRDELGMKLAKEKELEMYRKYPFLEERLNETEFQRRINEDPIYSKAYKELKQERQKAWDEANRIQSEKAGIIRRELNRKEEYQTKLSTYISMLSPLSDFTYLARDFSSTGMRNMLYFNEIEREWNKAFSDYSEKKRASLEKDNPAIDTWNTPVDMSDRPRFKYREEALAGRFIWTLPFFIVLILYNLIFFTASYVSFIKYDVR